MSILVSTLGRGPLVAGAATMVGGSIALAGANIAAPDSKAVDGINTGAFWGGLGAGLVGSSMRANPASSSMYAVGVGLLVAGAVGHNANRALD